MSLHYDWEKNPRGGWDCIEMEIEMIAVETYDGSTFQISGGIRPTSRILETISDREYARRLLAGEL